MRRIPSRAGLWVFATVCSAVVAFGGRQGTPQTELGERILNQVCTSCHDLRPIETQAMDKEGWTKTVKAMVDKGAALKADDAPAFIDYLVKNHGPLPDGAGKAILLNNCTICHSLERIREQPSTREEWDQRLGAMLNEGAQLSDEEFPVLLNYLARNFRPQ